MTRLAFACLVLAAALAAPATGFAQVSCSRDGLARARARAPGRQGEEPSREHETWANPVAGAASAAASTRQARRVIDIPPLVYVFASA